MVVGSAMALVSVAGGAGRCDRAEAEALTVSGACGSEAAQPATQAKGAARGDGGESSAMRAESAEGRRLTARWRGRVNLWRN